jgi:hypothetical protein
VRARDKKGGGARQKPKAEKAFISFLNALLETRELF